MADNTPENLLEISDGYRSQTGSRARGGECTRSPWRWVLCVIVVVVLIAVMGILMAMFGPGSEDLKYHDREDCKGKQSKQLMFRCKKSRLKCIVVQVKESQIRISRIPILSRFRSCFGKLSVQKAFNPLRFS